jgi:hypothetical protein
MSKSNIKNDPLQINTLLEKFCKIYKINPDNIENNNNYYFRLLCYKYNLFEKHIIIPPLILDSYYEAVLVEFREFPHVEFLIRNAINKLGPKWSFSIICGNQNFKLMQTIVNSISPNIKIIKCNIDNLNVNLYNKFLTSKHFWNLLIGEKILIYQEDSLIFKDNINDFLAYDYIGAPFPKTQNDTPNKVGNGGFSLRSKSIMLKIINSISPENTIINSDTLAYMKENNISYIPEDIYFSKNAQELGIGLISNYKSALHFSSETIFNPTSFGGHKFWINHPQWKTFLSNLFKIEPYEIVSNIEDYISYLNDKEIYKTNKLNSFDVDLLFCQNINNLNLHSKNEILKYIKVIGMEGIIYHPKQLINIFPSIKFLTYKKNLYIEYRNHIYKGDQFVDKYLYSNSYEQIYKFLIKKRYINFNRDYSLLLLVFIGNEKKGLVLIELIRKYIQFQNCNVAFCFNLNHNITESMKSYIKNNFEYYAVYESKEFGTDITPTMLMYDDIQKNYNFNDIIKLHSKTIEPSFTELTTFLLDKSLKDLKKFRNPICNCICNKKYYIKLTEDKFNNRLKVRYLKMLNVNFDFVAGTIFYCNKKIMDKSLYFLKQYYKNFLYNNLYDNNSINLNNSPIHFMERLYGTIRT